MRVHGDYLMQAGGGAAEEAEAEEDDDDEDDEDGAIKGVRVEIGPSKSPRPEPATSSSSVVSQRPGDAAVPAEQVEQLNASVEQFGHFDRQVRLGSCWC